MFDYYGKLSSEVYEIDKPVGTSFGDVEYYYSRLKDIKGEILEPAVGTGRILIPLASKGLDIEGFDISNDMLDICRRNLKDENLDINIFKDDLVNFSLDKKYEAIIIPTGTFLLITNREDSIKSLKSIYKHLNDGGKFIVDISLEFSNEIGKSSVRYWNKNDNEVITLDSKTIEIDYINQVFINHNRYERWLNKSLFQTELEEFKMRWYGVEEFKNILEDIGFKDISISSNYTYGKYPEKIEDVITFEAYR